MDDVRRIEARYDALAAEWRKVEPELRAIGYYLNPEQGQLSPGVTEPHRGFQSGIYSSYPVIYRDQMASQLYSTMVNPANQWMQLSIPDQDLMAWKPVADFLERETNLILASFATERSTFYTTVMSLVANWLTMGVGIHFDEYSDRLEKFTDRTLPTGRAMIERDEDNSVMACFWELRLTASQAVAQFGSDALPAKIVNVAAKGNDPHKFTFIRAIEGGMPYRPGMITAEGKPVKSTTIVRDESAVIRRSGFYEMPVTAPFYTLTEGHAYGRGLGHTVFATARLIQLQEEATTRAGQFGAAPINLVASEKMLPRGRQLRPGSTLYGAMIGGRRSFDQIGPPTSIAITREHQQAKLEELREAMHGALYHLQSRTGMTSSEWFDQHAAQLQRAAPMLTNLESEWITKKVARRYGMLQRMGLTSPAPRELDQMPLGLTMKSAASLALRASDGASTLQFLNDMGPLAKLSPQSQQRLDARLDPDGIMEVMVNARGAPPKVLRSREDADRLLAEAAQARQMQDATAAAPGMASALRDLTEMGQE